MTIYRDRITLTLAPVTVSELGAAILGTPAVVAEVWAKVSVMSATKTMMTFQQADIVGLDIEMRQHGYTYNGMIWEGHPLHFTAPDTQTDHRLIRINAYYEKDNPAV